MSEEKTKKSIFKKWWFWVGVVLIGGGIASQIGGDNTGSNLERSADNNATPSVVLEKRPEQQSEFITIVEKGQEDSKGADNDMQRGGFLSARSNSLCALLASKTVTNWTGWVERIDSNTDGKGVLEVRIARKVQVQTWNNAFSDIGVDTLLEPGTDLFNIAATLKKGQEVVFSGSFFSDDDHCIDEQSFTLNGKISDPEFTFKFSSIEPL